MFQQPEYLFDVTGVSGKKYLDYTQFWGEVWCNWNESKNDMSVTSSMNVHGFLLSLFLCLRPLCTICGVQSPWSSDLSPTPVYVGFLEDQMEMGQVSVRVHAVTGYVICDTCTF